MESPSIKVPGERTLSALTIFLRRLPPHLDKYSLDVTAKVDLLTNVRLDVAARVHLLREGLEADSALERLVLRVALQPTDFTVWISAELPHSVECDVLCFEARAQQSKLWL